jgi:hypothetical protein
MKAGYAMLEQAFVVFTSEFKHVVSLTWYLVTCIKLSSSTCIYLSCPAPGILYACFYVTCMSHYTWFSFPVTVNPRQEELVQLQAPILSIRHHGKCSLCLNPTAQLP